MPRAIYWTLTVTFAPLRYGDGKDADDFECSILGECLAYWLEPSTRGAPKRKGA